MIVIEQGHFVTCSDCDYRYFCTCKDDKVHISEPCSACNHAETCWSWDTRKDDDKYRLKYETS